MILLLKNVNLIIEAKYILHQLIDNINPTITYYLLINKYFKMFF